MEMERVAEKPHLHVQLCLIHRQCSLLSIINITVFILATEVFGFFKIN